jgi:hypothetical protein
VGKIVDEVVLHPDQLQGFLAEDKYDENTQQDDPDQDAQNEDDDPGVGGQDLILLQIEARHGRPKPAADLDIPVNVQKQRKHQGSDGEDEHQYGMKKPFHMLHGVRLLLAYDPAIDGLFSNQVGGTPHQRHPYSPTGTTTLPAAGRKGESNLVRKWLRL